MKDSNAECGTECGTEGGTGDECGTECGTVRHLVTAGILLWFSA